MLHFIHKSNSLRIKTKQLFFLDFNGIDLMLMFNIYLQSVEAALFLEEEEHCTL